MDPSTPRCRRSRPRPITATTPRGKLASSSGALPRLSPSTPRTKSSDAFCVSTPSTVDSEYEDEFPFDSSGEWITGIVDKKSSFQTPKREPLHSPLTKEKIRHIQKCSPLLSPQQQSPEESNNTRRPRRRMSTRTDHSNETNDSSRRSSPRRKPRRTTPSVKLEEKFLVLSSPTPIAASATPETPRRARRSSSVEPRRRRTASVERRRTGGGDLPPRRRLSMTKIGSASPQAPEILASPAARRLARHTQSVQQLTREKPLLLRNKSTEDLPFDWPDAPKRAFQ